MSLLALWHFVQLLELEPGQMIKSLKRKFQFLEDFQSTDQFQIPRVGQNVKNIYG